MCHNRAVLSDVELTLNGELSELTRLAATVEDFCRERGLDAGIEFDLNLALEELFVNALRHGGCEGMEQAIQIRLQAASDGVRVEFCDRGPAFDPMLVPPPDLNAPLASRQAGGLGIHLVHGVMHDLTYRRSGEWNCVAMRRPFTSQKLQ